VIAALASPVTSFVPATLPRQERAIGGGPAKRELTRRHHDVYHAIFNIAASGWMIFTVDAPHSRLFSLGFLPSSFGSEFISEFERVPCAAFAART